jgi:hypothetical protein
MMLVALPVQKPTRRNRQGKKHKDASHGSFIAMATSPDNRLFQLERPAVEYGREGRGGSYKIYEVTADGRFVRCDGPNIPSTFPSRRELAVEKFVEWAESMGYEAHVNEMATGAPTTEED